MRFRNCYCEWAVDPNDARSLSAPSCSVAEGVTEIGAMDDSADIPVARDGMTPSVRRRA